MKKAKGLWIDHSKAVIVAVTDKGEKVKELRSQVEKQRGRFEGVRSTTPYEAQIVSADDSQERVLTGHLDKYYNRVVAALCDADEIMIFGPGEAKGELLKRIENDDLIGRIARIEAADKMTIPQIAAKVRRYFQDTKSDSVQGGRTL